MFFFHITLFVESSVLHAFYSARLSVLLIVRSLLLGILPGFCIYYFVCAEEYEQLLTGNKGNSFRLMYRLCRLFLICSLHGMLCSGVLSMDEMNC
jgi:hypothetical protein